MRLAKNFQKVSKNLLTNTTEYGIINIESEVRAIEEKKAPRPPSKKDRRDRLLKMLYDDIESGTDPQEAVGKLSMAQYDFLLDEKVNLDNLILTPEQLKAITEVTRSPRPSGLTYNKKYPKERQDLYNSLVDCIIEQGGREVVRNKNFRDLDFEINGAKYKIVLSNPRTPKN